MPQVMADTPALPSAAVRGGRTPSRYQSAIYDFHQMGEGHAMVDAVAGSGKTTTLVDCCDQLAPSERMDAAFCAFNTHIAKELSQKLPTSMTVKTIHALGRAALYRALRPENQTDWLDGNKYRKIVRQYWKERGKDPWKMPDLVHNVLDTLRMCMLTRTVMDKEEAVAGVMNRYGILPVRLTLQEIMEAIQSAATTGIETASKVISFDDMIWLPVELGLNIDTFGHIYVDEAQDLSALQRELLFRMRREDTRMMFVGDPYQSIYGFAGADSQSFNNIRTALGGKDLPLSICYRCPSSHITLAQEIVPHIEARPGATNGVVAHAHYADLPNVLEAGDMVICRLTLPLVELCFHLISNGMPAKVRGRDIGEGLVRIIDTLTTQPGFRFEWMAEALSDWREMQLLRLTARDDTEMQVQRIEDQYACLDAMLARALSQNIRHLDGFRSYVTDLFSDDESIVTLCTVHKAKGLENHRVYILDPNLMPFPKAKTPDDMAQEWNLRYVALTRSKSDIYFVERPPK